MARKDPSQHPRGDGDGGISHPTLTKTFEYHSTPPSSHYNASKKSLSHQKSIPSLAEVGNAVKTVSSALTSVFIREWLLVIMLIFGGCCSNVYTLELLSTNAPKSGTLITFFQFLIVAAEGLYSNIEWGYSHTPTTDSTDSSPSASPPVSRTRQSGYEAVPSTGPTDSDDGAFAKLKAPLEDAASQSHSVLSWLPCRLRPRHVPMRYWFSVVALFWTVSVLNNIALGFRIAMPLHIIFRSGALFVSMVISWLFFAKRFSKMQVAGVLLVTAGVIVSTFASVFAGPSAKPGSSSSATSDNQPSLTEWITGLSILFTALVLACFLGHLQQITYTKFGRHWREGLFYTHFLGLPMFLFFYQDIMTQAKAYNESIPVSVGDYLGPFLEAWAPEQVWSTVRTWQWVSLSVPVMWMYLSFNLVTQYVCISGVHRLSSMTSVVTLNMILSVRKFLSLLLSIILFDNLFTTGHWIGTTAVFVGTFIYSGLFETSDRSPVGPGMKGDDFNKHPEPLLKPSKSVSVTGLAGMTQLRHNGSTSPNLSARTDTLATSPDRTSKRANLTRSQSLGEALATVSPKKQT
ncbi:UAA transporter family-domain-containing protein [Phlyctochytrium arcticum]|nr:UAA transporter family-domain-containing protein [Phlyctochytrium arcticum]